MWVYLALVLCIVAGRDLALPDSMRDIVAGSTPSGFAHGHSEREAC